MNWAKQRENLSLVDYSAKDSICSFSQLLPDGKSRQVGYDYDKEPYDLGLWKLAVASGGAGKIQQFLNSWRGWGNDGGRFRAKNGMREQQDPKLWSPHS